MANVPLRARSRGGISSKGVIAVDYQSFAQQFVPTENAGKHRAGKSWRKQPRDSGGEDGGQWVEDGKPDAPHKNPFAGGKKPAWADSRKGKSSPAEIAKMTDAQKRQEITRVLNEENPYGQELSGRAHAWWEQNRKKLEAEYGVKPLAVETTFHRNPRWQDVVDKFIEKDRNKWGKKADEQKAVTADALEGVDEKVDPSVREAGDDLDAAVAVSPEARQEAEDAVAASLEGKIKNAQAKAKETMAELDRLRDEIAALKAKQKAEKLENLLKQYKELIEKSAKQRRSTLEQVLEAMVGRALKKAAEKASPKPKRGRHRANSAEGVTTMDYKAFALDFVIDNGFAPSPVVLTDAWENPDGLFAEVVDAALDDAVETPEVETEDEAGKKCKKKKPDMDTYSTDGVETAEAQPSFAVNAEEVEAAADPDEPYGVEVDLDDEKMAAGDVVEATVEEVAAALDEVVENRFDPNQKRDPDGRWGDGIPGPQGGDIPGGSGGSGGGNGPTAGDRNFARRLVGGLKDEHSKLDGSNARQQEFTKEATYLHDIAEDGYEADGVGGNVARNRAQDDVNGVISAENRGRKAIEEGRIQTPEEKTSERLKTERLEESVAVGLKARRDSRQIADRDELNAEVSQDRHAHEDDYGRMYENLDTENPTLGSQHRARALADALGQLVDKREGASAPTPYADVKQERYLRKILEDMVRRGNPAYPARATQIVSDGLAARKGSGMSADELLKALLDPNLGKGPKVESPYHRMLDDAAQGFDVEKKRLFNEWGLG